MSCKSELHYGQYISYTGKYPLCIVTRPDLDFLSIEMTNNWKKVNCPECKAIRSTMQMIVREKFINKEHT